MTTQARPLSVGEFIPLQMETVTHQEWLRREFAKRDERLNELERRLAALKVEPIHGYVVAPIHWPNR